MNLPDKFEKARRLLNNSLPHINDSIENAVFTDDKNNAIELREEIQEFLLAAAACADVCKIVAMEFDKWKFKNGYTGMASLLMTEKLFALFLADKDN